LGWMIEDYNGLELIQHGGNTFGFTSDFAFLPEADLGVVVLSNARLGNLFNEGVRAHILSAIFEQESEYEALIDYIIEQSESSVEKLNEQIQESYDEEAVAPYLGTFSNDILGDITISEEEGKLILDVGEFISELRAYVNDDGETQYITIDAPVAGTPFEFTEEDGERVVKLDIVTDVYTFEKVE
jgi:CubicO group peptidase (beta-lactamase class C family)